MSARPRVELIDDESDTHESSRGDIKRTPRRKQSKDDKRLHRLRHATGIPSHEDYPGFRRKIMRLADHFVEVQVIGEANIPGGLDYYYPPYVRESVWLAVGEYPFVIATTHRTVWDIVAVGQIERGMTWLCKAPFAMLFYATLCHKRGAMPLLRKQDTRLKQPLRWLFERYTFHSLDEYEDDVLRALRLGIPAVIFPEGTRRADAVDATGSKIGAAAFARLADVPLIPAAAIGGTGKNGRDPERFRHKRTGRLLPLGEKPHGRIDRLRYRRLVVYVIGEPLEQRASELCGDSRTTARWEQQVTSLSEVGRQILRDM